MAGVYQCLQVTSCEWLEDKTKGSGKTLSQGTQQKITLTIVSMANNTNLVKAKERLSLPQKQAFRWPTTLPTTISVFWNGSSVLTATVGIGENIIRLMHLYPMAFCRFWKTPRLALFLLSQESAFAWGSWVPSHHMHIFTQVRWHAQSHLTSLLHSSEGITASLESWEWNMPAILGPGKRTRGKFIREKQKEHPRAKR